jgi:hypothetical protein
MKHSFKLSAIFLLLASTNALAAGKDETCYSEARIAPVTNQLPGYALSSKADTPATLASPFSFKPGALLAAARGLPVCIALVVDETGSVLDAAVFYPKRVALSKQEKANLLQQKYQPARVADSPVRSIVIMKASWD